MARRGVEKGSPSEPPAAAIDRYLAGVPPEHRAALEDLRATIKAAAPEAVEAISYSMPAFRYRGRFLVSYAAWARHCAFYPLSPEVQAAHEAEFDGLETSKGTIRFAPTSRMPESIVRAIVADRMAEIDRAWIREGRLAARKIGTQHIIDEADLEALDDDQLPLPPEWQTVSDGSPMPNVVRAVRLSRAGH
jgi:uncharacterized protein YdhG (YjbR/CyaY superfamily)